MLITICVFVGYVIFVVALLWGISRLKKVAKSNSCFLKEIHQDREQEILEETKTILRDALEVLQGSSTKSFSASYLTLVNVELLFQKSYSRTIELERARRQDICLYAEEGDNVGNALTDIVRDHFPIHPESASHEIPLLRVDFVEAGGDLALIKDQERLTKCRAFFEDCLQRLTEERV